ncbi:hypothetical protein GGI12_000008 [Dipsacomyces acuminosporus]|nr:hypothetical protein GGI12_000008 [Dipsacomyces acuminosporus]
MPLRSIASKQPGSPAVSTSESGERSKQVRFMATQPTEPEIDQAHLQELIQKLAQFERAIATLEAESRAQARNNQPQDGPAGAADSAGNTSTPYMQAVKGLVAAFIQLSKVSSATGAVKRYDKNTLAHFKVATQAVKLLMPHVSK